MPNISLSTNRLRDLILSKREISDLGCWEWTGNRHRQGYGKVQWKSKTYPVHRLWAHLVMGFDLNPKIMVCHKCDNPPCFNTAHLFFGTASENVRDAVIKKRQKESRKTHCPKGHPYMGKNLVIDQGKRKCRICKNARMRNWWSRRGNDWRKQRKLAWAQIQDR